MGPWCAQMDASSWIGMVVVWAVVIGLVVWAVTRLFPNGRVPADARAVLDERLARGEIDADAYRRLRSELDGAHPTPAGGVR